MIIVVLPHLSYGVAITICVKPLVYIKKHFKHLKMCFGFLEGNWLHTSLLPSQQCDFHENWGDHCLFALVSGKAKLLTNNCMFSCYGYCDSCN